MSAQVAGTFYAGLYRPAMLMPIPGAMIYLPPNSLSATAGINSYTLGGAAACGGASSAYVALAPQMATGSMMFTTLTTVSAPTCAGSGFGSGSGGLPGTWSSLGPCVTGPPAIAYFILHPQPGGACTCNINPT